MSERSKIIPSLLQLGTVADIAGSATAADGLFPETQLVRRHLAGSMPARHERIWIFIPAHPE
jgi:hypothetical protein